MENVERDYTKAFYAPYHPHARRMFKRLKDKFKMTCVYKKTATLGNFLFRRRPKPSIWDEKGVVYSVPCEIQSEQYIGNTKRKLAIRIMKHQKSCNKDLSDIQPDFKNDNGIPCHVATTGHSFKFQETRILDREKNYFKRKLLEGIYINKNRESCVNIIGGHRIDLCWGPIINDL